MQGHAGGPLDELEPRVVAADQRLQRLGVLEDELLFTNGLGGHGGSRVARAIPRPGRRVVVPGRPGDHQLEAVISPPPWLPPPRLARAVETYLVLTADHGFNASTFTTRVITSTGAGVGAA
ncbi:MAG: hypothetical protein KA190_09125, partial [Kofleriaceae bacterium]|nr:hypothetical protein [Kofleriaceae bacterium]